METELIKIFNQSKEELVQQFLSENIKILKTAFGSPRKREEVFSKFRFGNEYISDFVLIKSDWTGIISVVLIEIEPPTEKMFTNTGKLASRTNSAFAQVNDWLAWLNDDNNKSYFRNTLISKSKIWNNKLLRNWKLHFSSKIIIGRRSSLTEEDNRRRVAFFENSNKKIELIHFDRLIDIYREQ